MLTENQQHLINQITKEFSDHNKLQTSNNNSSLGIGIINSVNSKRKLIEEIKTHNSVVFTSMAMLCEAEIASLKEELDILGIPITRQTEDWYTSADEKRFIKYRIGDANSSYNFFIDIKIDGYFVNHEDKPLYELKKLQSKLIYDYAGNEYSFNELCSSQQFTDRLKKMYEKTIK